MSTKEIEKELQKRITQGKLLKNVEGVLDAYQQLIKFFPENIRYRKEVCLFILHNYEYADPYDYEDILLSLVEIAKEAQKKAENAKDKSFFYLYEFKFINELVRNDAYFYEQFSPEYMHQILDEAIKEDPSCTEAHEAKGDLYASDEAFDEAGEEYEYAVSIKEDDTSLFNLALNNRLEKKDDEAILNFKKLLARTESAVVKQMALENLIELYAKRGDKGYEKRYQEELDNLI